MPFKLKQGIANNEIQIRNQTVLLDAKKKEISRINAKYDADRRRYVELTGGKAGSQKRKIPSANPPASASESRSTAQASPSPPSPSSPCRRGSWTPFPSRFGGLRTPLDSRR